jgi:A/G-specific adenine glycosylase
MLQQTQVARVAQKYRDFLNRFPSLRSLARATQRDVVMAWRGLGYNNRAVRLHALARQLHSSTRGRIPDDIDALMRLPGIGRYTAHAVAAFAFGRQVPVVDVNVRRVLSRLSRPMPDAASVLDEPAAWKFAGTMLPRGKAYDWNQALMDLGATVCTASHPRCSACPLTALCASREALTTASGTTRGARQRTALRARAPRAREQSHRGKPMRLYRGMIIEALRDAHPRRSVAASHLRMKVLPESRDRDRQVFHAVIGALERDGLIRVRRDRNAIPERVSLA